MPLLRTCSVVLSLSLLTSALSGCHHAPEAPAPTAPSCPGAGPFVKSVVDRQGTVSYDRAQGHYVLISPREPATSTGAVDVGILCDSLPRGLRTLGQRVRFSGAYWQQTTGATSGDIYSYYLSLDKIASN